MGASAEDSGLGRRRLSFMRRKKPQRRDVLSDARAAPANVGCQKGMNGPTADESDGPPTRMNPDELGALEIVIEQERVCVAVHLLGLRTVCFNIISL
mmetsp:Transcript_35751/g.68791  ORF Transcript_35751/g.68791 Transcript_35751/m.68791 type:complete len:97 (+) Transcript_35751:327-617(+)